MSTGNIADRLRASTQAWPDRAAVITSKPPERRRTFAELDREVDQLTAGLQSLGIRPGHRIVLMVRPGIEFIALTFALYRTGAIVVLIDPGMGRTNIFRCLEEVAPDGFVAIPIVQLIRLWKRKLFPSARFNVTVGTRLPGLGPTYRDLLTTGQNREPDRIDVASSDPAAIIFTSGSTGPPKGVLYEHGMFNAQVDLIQQQYGIQPGEVDLPGFPLFGLFNAAMGVTTVVPDMDPTKPAFVDPVRILRAIEKHNVTQAFGSPAFWNRVGPYCVKKGITLPTLNRALSAGGPVPNHVLETMQRVLTKDGADIFTPYGATESLPVASIGANEILGTTAAKTRAGAGTCVGRPFPQVEIRIIQITEGPIASINDAQSAATGEIGEIIVRSPSVTREYYRRPEATALSKIADPRPHPGDSRPSVWHRIGDVGYLDSDGLLWFCGRKAHIVYTSGGPMYSVCCEAIFETHKDVFRAALVGLGQSGDERPVVIVQPHEGRFPNDQPSEDAFRKVLLELARSSPLTVNIEDIRFHPSLPVDTRHNVKIQREALREWATQRLT